MKLRKVSRITARLQKAKTGLTWHTYGVEGLKTEELRGSGID